MRRSPRVISIDPTGKVQSVEEPRRRDKPARLRRLAWLLDSSIRIPGTKYTIGFDALIGLFPVLGDVLGALLSGYIVFEAARLGAPGSVLARMLLNVAVEALVGVVPVAGDLFDAAWKANVRNVDILDAWLSRQGDDGSGLG